MFNLSFLAVQEALGKEKNKMTVKIFYFSLEVGS